MVASERSLSGQAEPEPRCGRRPGVDPDPGGAGAVRGGQVEREVRMRSRAGARLGRA